MTERLIPVRAVIFIDRHHPNHVDAQFMHVYSDLVLEKLQDLPGLELVPEPIYLDELQDKAALARNVEIIFSKWGMPEISRETIARYFSLPDGGFLRGRLHQALRLSLF